MTVQLEKEEVVKDYTREDVVWLLSLSEFELELLTDLKKLVIRRAEIVGHEVFAKKFSFKLLRSLGVTVMQYVKKHGKDLSIPGSSEAARWLDAINLLKCNIKDGAVTMDIDDLEMDGLMLMNPRKRKIPTSSEHPDSKRQKSTISEVS